MSTNTPHEIEAHAEAERIWSLNFADRPTEEFEGLLAVVERGQRSDRLRAKLTPEYEFLHYHFVALRDIWTPLSALYGDENSGTRHGQYDTLVWLGVAERKVEDICDASGRLRGSKVFYRLAQESAPPAADIDPALYGLPQDSEVGPEVYPEPELKPCLVAAEKDHDCVECGAPATICDLNADDEAAFFCDSHSPVASPAGWDVAEPGPEQTGTEDPRCLFCGDNLPLTPCRPGLFCSDYCRNAYGVREGRP